MTKEEEGGDKALFVIVYAVVAMSGAFMGFLGGIITGWIWWG